MWKKFLGVDKMKPDTKVKLKVDLIRYHSSLKIGTEGITVGRQGIWSRNYGSYITVKFPEHTLDVLWKSLEIIDKEYLSKIAEIEKELSVIRSKERKG